MSAVLAPLGPRALLPTQTQTDPWLRLGDAQRDEALRLHAFLLPAIDKVNLDGLSIRKAASWLRRTRGKEMGNPSEVSIARWISDFQRGGLPALAPQYKGRQRRVLGCEAVILRYYQRPSQPDAGDISFWLKQDHDLDVSASWIRSYLKSLPSNQTETSPRRVGQHYYDQNIRPHHRRDPDDIAVGEVWVSDGHRMKAIVRHPNSDNLYRVEVTPVLDKASNYLYGWWVAENESAMNTVYALCRMMMVYNHVPVWFQTDPGPGFKNHRVQALLDFLHVNHVPTRAGNARGKDFGEGFFHLVTKRISKRFETFCGDDRTDDALARMRTKVKRGQIYVPTLDELRAGLERFRETYNAWPQKRSVRLKGKCPNDRIGELQRNALSMPVADLLRPSRVATVSHWEVRVKNRFYRAAELAGYERRKVVVQYDEHDEGQVWVRDSKHRLVCIAQLVGKTQWAKESVAADARDQSRRAAIARKQVQIDEINRRGVEVIDAGSSAAERMLEVGHSFMPQQAIADTRRAESTADETLRGLEHFKADELPPSDNQAEGLQPLDLYDTDYGNT